MEETGSVNGNNTKRVGTIIIGRYFLQYIGVRGGGCRWQIPPEGNLRIKAILDHLSRLGIGQRPLHLVATSDDRKALEMVGLDLSLLAGPQPAGQNKKDRSERAPSSL